MMTMEEALKALSPRIEDLKEEFARWRPELESSREFRRIIKKAETALLLHAVMGEFEDIPHILYVLFTGGIWVGMQMEKQDGDSAFARRAFDEEPPNVDNI